MLTVLKELQQSLPRLHRGRPLGQNPYKVLAGPGTQAMPYRWIVRRLVDLKISAIFLTRLPLSHGQTIARGDLSRALWSAPIIGAGVGALGAGVYGLAYALHLPPLPSATLAVAATALATGCLHEDGLADVADGFGGGTTRERKLEIMRDSRIGTYGCLALLMSCLLRVGALASLAEPASVTAALIAAGAIARAGLAPFMALVPAARADGMSAYAGAPPPASAIAAGLLGLIALVCGLGPVPAMAALLCLAAGLSVLAWLCRTQIGGQTGDVLGAVEQIGEIAVLLVATAAVSWGRPT
jgi:adenosylcobinamide-GDP ribazoletransferase